MSPKVKLETRVGIAVRPFPLKDVRLLPSYFQTQFTRNAEYLLTLDAKRFLHRHYENAGLEPLADCYDGWEKDTISGHSFGHWLTGLALTYAATGDELFKAKALEAVKLTKPAQDADPHGFVGGYPDAKKLHDELRQGEIRSQGFDLNGWWVPWYNTHKLLAGLIDVYLVCDDPLSLEIAKKLGDFSIWVTANLSDGQWQNMLACEYGGMNESLADLAAVTGDDRYLALAEKFYDFRVMDPLAAREPKLANFHANTQVPKAIGAARIYELTGDNKFKTIASYFWEQVVNDHTYANGGNSSGEYFGQPGKLSSRLSDSTSETCNTYNMLKLSEHLYAWTGDQKYQDYYERAMWNHILGSQDEHAGKTYYVPLRIGGQKTYSDAEHSFTCCHGSGMESQAKYGLAVFARTDDTLLVNQFLPSELDSWESGIKARLETDFPVSGKLKLVIEQGSPAITAVQFRFPHWASHALVKGERLDRGDQTEITFDSPGGLHAGQTFEVEFPMEFRREPLPDAPNRVALFYGPVLLAGDLESLVRMGQVEPLPVIVTGKRPVAEWLSPVPGKPLHFKLQGVGRPQDFELVPFYEVLHDHYTVYWDDFTDDEWEQRQADYRAEQDFQRELENKTVDFFHPGNMQSERDHNVQGENTTAGTYSDRSYRHAKDGGWFSFDLKVDPETSNLVLLTLWGNDGGNRVFSVLADGVKVDEIMLERNHPGKFYDERIELPEDITKGKSQITLRLQAEPHKTAGGLYGARVVRI